MAKKKRKVPVIKTKAVRGKTRKSRRVREFQVWTLGRYSLYHVLWETFSTKNDAEKEVEEIYDHQTCLCPVIVEIEILPMEY